MWKFLSAQGSKVKTAFLGMDANEKHATIITVVLAVLVCLFAAAVIF